MTFFLNFFRTGTRESMLHLLCWIGVCIMFGSYALVCLRTKTFPEFGWSNVAALGILITGKSYQRKLDTQRELSDKAIEHGAPLNPQPQQQ